MITSFKIEWNDAKVKAISNAPVRALYLAGEGILEEANRLVPHDQGTLQNSGTVTCDELPDGQAVFDEALGGKSMAKAFPGQPKSAIMISYNTPYAVRLHEHPEYEFQDDRQGKWLETALNEHAERILLAEIEKETKKA